MNDQYILAIDQGTFGTKTVIFTPNGELVIKATANLKSYFPQVGFVEQNPEEIYQSALESVKACVKDFTERTSGNLEQIVACGISNQRETFVLWDESGAPLSNAVVWQCKRSVGVCDRLKESGIEEEIKARTGLIIDPYFSGTKLIWLYENDAQIKNVIDEGKAFFGTVDSWLLFRLTKGLCYHTDYTNACRTLFFNINDLQWDKYLLDEFHLCFKYVFCVIVKSDNKATHNLHSVLMYYSHRFCKIPCCVLEFAALLKAFDRWSLKA